MDEKLAKKDLRRTFWKTVGVFAGSHIGGVLISLLFCFGLSTLLADGMYYVMIPLILFLYAYPLYGTMWNAGLRDRSMAKHEHMPMNPFRGLIYGAVAISPIIVMAIGFVLSRFGLLFNYALPFKLINAEIWPIMNALNTSVFMPDFEIWQVFVIAFVAVAVPLGIGEFAYYLGTKEISLKQKFMYKDVKKEDPRKR